MPSSSFLTIVSKCSVNPETKSTIGNLKLSVSDLPMLSCHYIQKGLLFTRPHPLIPIDSLLSLLKRGLSQTLTHFPALAGRLTTDSDGFVHVACNDAGVDFIHANAGVVSIRDILSPTDVPDSVKEFFALDGTVSFEGHFKPILAVQVTELADGLFIGCAVNHSVTDGTSFWNFFNTFAELSRGAKSISRQPDLHRNYFKDSSAVIRFPNGCPKVTFDEHAPIRERIFRFSREAIQKLKSRANSPLKKRIDHGFPDAAAEIMGKQSNDCWKNNDGENQNPNGNITSVLEKWLRNAVSKHQGLIFETETETEVVDLTVEISSFQSLCAQLWRSITRARKLAPSKMATFRMAVNCRQRIEPRVDPYYFGNAIQSIPTVASAGDILSRDLRWCAVELNRNVVAHDDAKVRGCVEDWEKNPRCFPLGNFDGASITMGSSPRFPMYDNDFGWGRPLAIRSGRANKFDGKISAFPGREGPGSVDLEVCLSPETMAGLENDSEFMQYVSVY
ncbi:Transferase [Macleaya cordata]|uniref:Transferase n=1 Tax=Macleaya cordata TaxID=56857 RepID=A0A200R4N9_MACCD|nr:Transferase [Macleaya cordata]